MELQSVAGSRGAQAPVSALRRSPLFSGCSESDLGLVARISSVRLLRPRQILFWQGDSCAALHLLTRGAVKLVRRSGSRYEKVMRLVEPVDSFDESALYSGAGHTTTAVALEESELLAVHAMRFTRLLECRDGHARRLLARLSERLVRLADELEALSVYSAKQRVAAYLLDRLPAGDGDRAPATLPGTRADLASLLSISPETLCRVLRRFEQEGSVALENGTAHVIDREKLHALLPRD